MSEQPTLTCTRRAHSTWTTCECQPCRAENKRLAKLQRNGAYRRPSSAQATVRILGWFRDGYSAAWIASACGISTRYVDDVRRDLAHTGARRIGPRRAAQILAADITTATAGHAPADQARAQLRALATLGWSLADVAAVTGIPQITLSTIRAGRVARTGPGNLAAIRDAYRTLARQPGPSPAAATRARALGWATVIDLEDAA